MTPWFLCLSMLFLPACSVLNHLEAPRSARPLANVIWSKNFDPVYNTGNLPIGLTSPTMHQGILYIGSPLGKMSAFDLDNGRTIWSANDRHDYHSEPVVYKDFLLYGTNEGRVFSRNRLTGAIHFSIELGAAIEARPVVYRDRAFFHLRDHKLVCLDVETGKILWTYKRSVPYTTTI